MNRYCDDYFFRQTVHSMFLSMVSMYLFMVNFRWKNTNKQLVHFLQSIYCWLLYIHYKIVHVRNGSIFNQIYSTASSVSSWGSGSAADLAEIITLANHNHSKNGIQILTSQSNMPAAIHVFNHSFLFRNCAPSWKCIIILECIHSQRLMLAYMYDSIVFKTMFWGIWSTYIRTQWSHASDRLNLVQHPELLVQLVD